LVLVLQDGQTERSTLLEGLAAWCLGATPGSRHVESNVKIDVAHVNIQGINCAVFDADATDRSARGRSALLERLTERARASGLAVSKRALRFTTGRSVMFFGDQDLVAYLRNHGWALSATHTIDV
jgi:hypothetical protein